MLNIAETLVAGFGLGADLDAAKQYNRSTDPDQL